MVDKVISVVVGGREFNDLKRGLSQVHRNLDKSFDKSAVAVSKELRKALEFVAQRMRELHGTRYSVARSFNTGRENLLKRSGAGLRGIAKSIRVNRPKTLEKLVGSIGAPFPMIVHETGATIRGRGKLLTIPLPAALNISGLPLRRRARDWENTFVARSRRGNLIIFQKRREKIVPLYVLKESVRIPARLKLAETVTNEGLPLFQRRAFEVISQALDEVV